MVVPLLAVAAGSALAGVVGGALFGGDKREEAEQNIKKVPIQASQQPILRSPQTSTITTTNIQKTFAPTIVQDSAGATVAPTIKKELKSTVGAEQRSEPIQTPTLTVQPTFTEDRRRDEASGTKQQTGVLVLGAAAVAIAFVLKD